MEGYVFMDEMEKALREELEKHLDTLRRNLEVVPMDVLKTKYKKPYQELKESICSNFSFLFKNSCCFCSICSCSFFSAAAFRSASSSFLE